MSCFSSTEPEPNPPFFSREEVIWSLNCLWNDVAQESGALGAHVRSVVELLCKTQVSLHCRCTGTGPILN